MTMLQTNANEAYLAAHVDELIIQPVMEASIAMQVATVVQVSEAADRFSVPIVTDDPTAAWTAEGDPIDPSDATLDQTGDYFHALKGLTKMSNELVDDADPAVLQIVGDGLSRDVARKIDQSFFGAGGGLAPTGLEAVTNVTNVADGGYVDLDPFAEAISEAENLGTIINSWVTDPATALALAQLKDQSDSLRPLLGTDPNQPGRRTPLGIPLFVSPYVTPGVVWGIPKPRVLIGLRKGTDIQISTEAYFGNDMTAIRVVSRVTFVYPHEAAIIRIGAGGS